MTSPGPNKPVVESTPETPSATTVNDPDAVGAPPIHTPGQPPGADALDEPNRVMARRQTGTNATPGAASTATEPVNQVAPNRIVVSRKPAPPAASEKKEAWVEYAVARGADKAEADKHTKDELIATYGGKD